MANTNKISYWADGLSQTIGQHARMDSFWNKLTQDMQDYVATFNVGVETPMQLEIKNQTLSVMYGRFSLLLHFDRRSGELSYRFISCDLQTVRERAYGLTDSGTIIVRDSKGSFFAEANDKDLDFGKSLADVRAWPAYERLCQYFLQKLLDPQSVDNRFVAQEKVS